MLWLIVCCFSALADCQVMKSIVMANHYFETAKQKYHFVATANNHWLIHSPSVIDCCIIVGHHLLIQALTGHGHARYSILLCLFSNTYHPPLHQNTGRPTTESYIDRRRLIVVFNYCQRPCLGSIGGRNGHVSWPLPPQTHLRGCPIYT